MRIAFTTVPEYSHLAPTVLPAARMVRDAGHEVVVATSRSLAPVVKKAGLPALVLPTMTGIPDLRADPERMRSLGMDLSFLKDIGVKTIDPPRGAFAALFAGPFAKLLADELIEVVGAWGPDVLVHESTAYGGYYAAQRLGVPNAAIDIAPMEQYGAPELLEQMNIQRSALGLPPVDDPYHPFRELCVGVVPDAFSWEDRRIPGERHYRMDDPSEGRLDPAVLDLPIDRPWVLATLGSAAQDMFAKGPSALDTIVEVLGELPVTGVVALGGNRTPEHWRGARPDNVYLASFVPQRLLLPACDLFITHAGFNGIREALGSGIPMVTLPIFADQVPNAERMRALGVSVRIDLDNVDRGSLAAACRMLLNDPAYRYRARDMQRRFLTLPEFRHFVDDLVALSRRASTTANTVLTANTVNEAAAVKGAPR